VQANLSGFNLVLIAGVESFYDSTIFGRPGITRPEQLKGKRLGISGYGAATHFAALILLKHLNLEAGKDVILVPGGPDAERVAALAAGKIDASVFNSSTVPVAKKMGFTELVYIPDLGVEVQGNGFATTRAYLKGNREIVKAALKGYIEGINFTFHNKQAAQKVYAKYMRTNDPEVLEQSYQVYVKTTPKKPYPTLKGLQFLLDQLAPQMPQAKSAKPEQFVDLSLLQELEKEGFFTEMTKRYPSK
jgi:NitT/TauT family transport system substrate-binding protein